MIRKIVLTTGLLMILALACACGGTYTLLRGEEDASGGHASSAAAMSENDVSAASSSEKSVSGGAVKPDSSSSESGSGYAGSTESGSGQAGSAESDSGYTGSAGEQAGMQEAGKNAPQLIYVYVCGAVRTPGVYTLPAGSRIFEAVQAAGGLTEEADARSLNQAGVLEDGQQITVYTGEETAGGAAEAFSAGNSSSGGTEGKTSLVNLNTAPAEELMTLPGIGEARAAAIIAYREQNGAFSAAEDIMKIDGIKEKAFAKIKDYITV